MKKTILTLSSVLGLTFMAHGQATTAAVGYNTVTCLPNSDTIVSVPFLNTTDSISTTVSGTASETGSAPDNIATFTMANVSGLTNDQYADKYYVRFTSGQLEGNIYQITGNTATTVSIALLGDSSVQIEDGNKFSIYKFWTLGTLFPPATQSTIVPAPNPFQALTRSLVLLPAVNATGTNIAPNRSFYILDNNWNEVGGSTADDTILWPDSYFIIRHSGNITESTTYRPSGTVDAQNFVIPLLSTASGLNDNYVAVPRPVAVKIKDLGLTTTGTPPVFEPKSSPFDSNFDRLLVFDNSQALRNKSASATYFYDAVDGRWEKFGTDADAGDDLLEPSSGIIIRKVPSASDTTVFWTNTPKY